MLMNLLKNSAGSCSYFKIFWTELMYSALFMTVILYFSGAVPVQAQSYNTDVASSQSGTAGIYDSFSRAEVSGESSIGGLVGSLAGGTIERTYSAGHVSGTGDNVGGLLGQNESGTVSASYWDTQVSGQAASAGGLGRTTAQMTHAYAANTYVDWDFEDVWTSDARYTLNNGYPLLQAIPKRYTVTVNIGSEGGQVLGAGEYLHGAWVELTAVPDQGYRFLHWKDDQGRMYTARTLEFRATEGRTFTAYFEELKAALPGVLMLLLDEEE